MRPYVAAVAERDIEVAQVVEDEARAEMVVGRRLGLQAEEYLHVAQRLGAIAAGALAGVGKGYPAVSGEIGIQRDGLALRTAVNLSPLRFWPGLDDSLAPAIPP